MPCAEKNRKINNRGGRLFETREYLGELVYTSVVFLPYSADLL